MKSRSRLLGVLAALPLCLAGCEPRGSDAGIENASASTGSSADAPMARFQSELLDVAFDAATAIPTEPHFKERCRAQEAVVVACLELEQPLRAQGYAEKVANWRRGTAYADLALYWARHRRPELAQPLLDLAAQDAEREEDWPRDRIRVKIASVHAFLGQNEKAAAFEANATESEAGRVDRIKAMLVDQSNADQQMSTLDAGLASSNFDLARNSLDGFAEIFNRLYGDQPRRDLAEQKIRSGWSKLPTMIRLELMMKLARSALDHQDKDKALQLVNEAQLMLEGGRMLPEYRVPLSARLAGLRFLAGDIDKARQDAGAVMVTFDADRKRILSIDRADAIRPLAEAYQTMGDTAAALSTYKQVIEAGMENANSRPRAEDLSATCLSMAVNNIEPDTELWTRIRTIHEGLGDPW
ncbi:MAG: hypothetical protein L0Y44_02180 [Phycisphaerales bacterium]|nr:hypothetical protein [Phycisphaerales bacterium]